MGVYQNFWNPCVLTFCEPTPRILDFLNSNLCFCLRLYGRSYDHYDYFWLWFYGTTVRLILTRGELVFAVSALFFSLLGNTLARTNTVIARDLLFLYYSFWERNKNLSETFFTQIRLYLALLPKRWLYILEFQDDVCCQWQS